MIIPYQSLSPDALQSVLDEIVTREGTEYGEIEVSREAKIQQAMQALSSGVAQLAFDADSGSLSLVPVCG